MTGIIILSLVPLRTSNSETSEMCSQLLFGEVVEVIEVQDRWLNIRNLSDNYTGWADRKMIRILSANDEKRITESSKHYVHVPLSICNITASGQKMFLAGGSILYNLNEGECTVANETYRINLSDVSLPVDVNGILLIDIAKQYLNSPYLWGGKSVLGIDCSGLVQLVFAIGGIRLPRDASQQVECGRSIDFLSESKPGDLAFFENAEGKIIHVGILLNSHQIIHASGWVKIENIDSHGIISIKTGEYTHRLRVVKRIV